MKKSREEVLAQVAEEWGLSKEEALKLENLDLSKIQEIAEFLREMFVTERIKTAIRRPAPIFRGPRSALEVILEGDLDQVIKAYGSLLKLQTLSSQ